VRPLGVVVTPPALDDDFGLGKRVKDLSIKQFVAKPGVEALDEAVLLRTAPLNVGRFGPDGSDPVLHGAASVRIILSSVRSDTARRSRAFADSDEAGHAFQKEAGH
jgi:hypothetical protein